MNVKRKERTIHPLPYSAPSLSSSYLLSQARSAWSRTSHSEASLAASSSSSATGGPDVRPTSVAAKTGVPPDCTARRRAAPRCWYGPCPVWGRGASLSPRTGVLLASPLGAVLEQVLPGLDTVLAPPAGGVRSAGCPSQILTGQAVPRLHLVEARGEALVRFRYRRVRLLLFAGTVFSVPGPGELLPGPALDFCPLLLGEAALDVGKRARQGEFPLAGRTVRVFLVENHSTPWASGSSAASLAHLSATSLPSIPWWLGRGGRRCASWPRGRISALVPDRRRPFPRWPLARP